MNTILFVGEHPRTYSVQWHSHDYWEMVYCTSGRGEFQFENGTTLAYKEGDVVCIPSYERHNNASEEGFTNIHLTMETPTHPYKSAFRVSDDEGHHLRIAFEQARFYYLADMKGRDMVLAALGQLICSYLVVYRSNNDFSEPVEQIRMAIIRNFGDAYFALDDYIRGLPFHYDYLRKLFKKEVGVTPLEYMTSMRMRKAETLLTPPTAGAYTIGEVAAMCGFDDALYFSRVFKKYFGCSPSVYAKRHAKPVEKEPTGAGNG